jgi:hypothetical protein
MLSHSRRHLYGRAVLACIVTLACFAPAAAQEPAAPTCAGPGECLCDSSYEDCRTPILQLIRAETVGIDVSYWFMSDARYSAEIIRRWQAGVPVRILLDTEADSTYAGNKSVRDSFVSARIPIRNKVTTGINHWKAILYAGQRKIHFSAANFANGSYSPIVPYTQYVDEAIYFTDDADIVDSFLTKFDDHWTDPTHFADFANVTPPLTRNYPTHPIHPDLNFVPDQHYENRLRGQAKLETQQIDVVMFRILSDKLPDVLMARFQAGVNVRLITEQEQYRTSSKFWHAYNVDRMYDAGIPIKVKNNLTEQDVHQKSIVLHSRGLAAAGDRGPMVIFGSSNWSSASSTSQREHNYFTRKPWIIDWFIQQFERKWNNRKADGTPIGTEMFIPFTPLPPTAPVYASPANEAFGVGASIALRWEGGYWAHKYDVYLSTSPTFGEPVIRDYMPGSATAGVQSAKESYTVSGLAPGTTYYWMIVGKTMANLLKAGPTWSFTTAAGVPPPPAPGGLIATSVASTLIDLAWNDVAGEEGYKIERKLSTESAWTQIRTNPADVVSYRDTNSGLAPGRTYNYRVRAFTTGGYSGYSNTLTVTTPTAQLSPDDVVLHAAEASPTVGSWVPVADSTAAGGQRLENANAGATRTNSPLATPTHYFEMRFTADADRPYRLWMRGKAYNNNGYNDSVHVQFSDTVDANGAPIYRIGSTSGTAVNLEDCTGCGVQGWGWQDNGFGAGVLGPTIRFASSGVHVLRVQIREDGVSFDQIVLSPDTYLNASPGALKNDTIILPKQNVP